MISALINICYMNVPFILASEREEGKKTKGEFGKAANYRHIDTQVEK